MKSKYVPRKGFYNLSKKPKTLTKKEHKQVQETQMLLMRIEERKHDYMKDEIIWRKVKEMSTKLQQVIFQHYVDQGDLI